jgi:ribonuclease VapC
VLVVDTSAIIAVLNQEPEAARISAILIDSPRSLLSAANLVEATLVASKFRTHVFDPDGWLDEFIRVSKIDVEPVSVEQAQLARAAFHKFGKGTGHGAGLNFGDCFAYALAKFLDVPLLYKSGDFGRTDVASALP